MNKKIKLYFLGGGRNVNVLKKGEEIILLS